MERMLSILTMKRQKLLLSLQKIYYQGKFIPDYNSTIKKQIENDLNGKLKDIFTDGSVKIGDDTYTVKFDVTAEVNNQIKQEDLKAGENIMVVDWDKANAEEKGSCTMAGDKLNSGVIASLDAFYRDHKIGHMLGFKERFTDYENSSDPKEWLSISHDGYKRDLMGAKAAWNLNQSHYDEIVSYTTANLIQTQKKSINVTTYIDASSASSTVASDIPAGWQPRAAAKKNKQMKSLVMLSLFLVISISCFSQTDTVFKKQQIGFLFLSDYNYLYDYDGIGPRPLGFHDFFYPAKDFNAKLLEDSNVIIVFKNGVRVDFIENRKQLKIKAKSFECIDTSHCYEFGKFYVVPVIIDYDFFEDNHPFVCRRNFYELQVTNGSRLRFEYMHKAIRLIKVRAP